MIYKYLGYLLILLLLVSSPVLAQEEDLKAVVDYKANKMKVELNLTDAQAETIKPIIKDYLVKRSAVLQEVDGEGIVDHDAVEKTLKKLQDSENQQLSKVLSEDQLKKLINKEDLMAALNPDNLESTVDDGPTLTANGANFKF